MRHLRLCISGQLQHFSGVQSQGSIVLKLSGLSFKCPELTAPHACRALVRAGTLRLLFSSDTFFLSQLNEKVHVFCLFSFGFSKIPKQYHQTHLEVQWEPIQHARGRRPRRGELPRKECDLLQGAIIKVLISHFQKWLKALNKLLGSILSVTPGSWDAGCHNTEGQRCKLAFFKNNHVCHVAFHT